MRKRLAAAAAAVAAGAALVLPATAQAATSQTSGPASASKWVIYDGPYSSLSKCGAAIYMYGFSADEAYCNQEFKVGEWWIIAWV